jgi:peptidoglycan hydrolase-like protein with peptidoglycan-binding domain
MVGPTALLQTELEYLAMGNTSTRVSNAPPIAGAPSQNETLAAKEKQPNSAEPLPIYPNPTAGDVTIITEVKQAGPITIQITDLQGRVAYSKTFSWVGVGHRQVSLSHTGLKAGSYIVKVVSKGDVQTGKLVVKN